MRRERPHSNVKFVRRFLLTMQPCLFTQNLNTMKKKLPVINVTKSFKIAPHFPATRREYMRENFFRVMHALTSYQLDKVWRNTQKGNTRTKAQYLKGKLVNASCVLIKLTHKKNWINMPAVICPKKDMYASFAANHYPALRVLLDT